MMYCYACHGENGDGRGPSAPTLYPPPRNFQKGIFKFAGVSATGKLPSDADLDRIIHHGLNGTPMLPWDIPEKERFAIIQYIKTFYAPPDPKKVGDKSYKPPISPWYGKTDSSGKFTDKKQEPEFTPATEDPFQTKETEAITFGKLVYHTKAQCSLCHASYLTTEEYTSLRKPAIEHGFMAPDAVFEPRQNAYDPQGKESVDYKSWLLPPDFLRHPVRSVRLVCRGEARGVCPDRQRLGDFYRIIANGIPGTAMPPWQKTLKPDELWALVHYVKWLHDKQLPGGDARAFRDNLLAQPPFVPPAPPPDTRPPVGAETAPPGGATPGAVPGPAASPAAAPAPAPAASPEASPAPSPSP